MAEIEARRFPKRMEFANIPNQLQGWGWDSLQPYAGDEIAMAQAWVQAFIAGKIVENSGLGLLLHGAPGQGKTALAAVTLQEALRGANARSWGDTWVKDYQPFRGAHMAPYRHFPQLTQRQFNNATTEAEDYLLLDIRGDLTTDTAVRLLVLDDVGKEHRTASGWAASYFEELIRTRFYNGWPTIITTNFTPEQFTEIYGESAGSFIHEAFEHVKVASPTGDRRVAK
jgi:DNA replication protein DnaC